MSNHKPQPVFVIPTYRLREVGQAIEAYDDHFRRNGHAIDMIVFDDSSVANHEKYYEQLQVTQTHNPLYYVGPHEKEQFMLSLFSRLRDRKLEPLVRSLFRPSYGGNRNYTLIYTLGNLLISADDDMRPAALMEDSPETLDANEISRGKLMRRQTNGYTAKSFDILTSFLDVLGKPVSEAPKNYERGELIVDSAMDLETNASQGLHREHALTLQAGNLPDHSIVKMAQTFRSGTSDIDALDYVSLFLDDESQTDIEKLNDDYVLVNFRPALTKRNWRMDCGVAGYDNTLGLPAFFPTRLRFEDYVHRLWIQQDGIAAAHVDAAQNHIKSNYMRSPMASEVFNEEVANLLKRKIKGTLTGLDELSISFDYDGYVTLADSEEILGRISTLRNRVLTMMRDGNPSPERREALNAFAVSLERSFYGFEPDFFQQNLGRLVDDEVSQIKGAMEIWPTLIEICFLRKHRTGLPRRKVQNRPCL